MPKGEAEAKRERRGYVAVVRLGLITATSGLVAFLLLIRGNVFDPDVTSWPLLASAAVWALGMMGVLWARSHINGLNAEAKLAAQAPLETSMPEAPASPVEGDYWHADDADRAAHAAREAEREGA
jgi:hypothetical protein